MEVDSMSVVEIEHRRSRHAPRKPRKKQKVQSRPVGIGHNLGPPLDDPSLAPLLDDRCLTFRQWCALNGISPRNGRRILKSGTGPRVMHLSERRIGITVRANREWQAARERA
jgi:hypothetical protein